MMMRLGYALRVTQGTLILSVMLSCGQVHNQHRKNLELVHLLPSPPAGWQQAGKALTFSGVSLSDYIDGGAEAYFAYGFQTVAVKEFRNDANARLTMEIYEMDRPENAYGVFSTDCAGEHWDIGAGASYGSGLLRFWKGPYFTRILCFPPDPSMEAAIRETGVKVAHAISAESRLPDILKVLPERSVYPDTVCYFHRQTSLNNIRFLSDENLLHLGDEVEALTWEQKAAETAAESHPQKKSTAKLRQVVLRYPFESLAETAFGDFTLKYLRLASLSTIDVRAGDTLITSMPDGKYAAATLRAPWLLIILDADSAESAKDALAQTKAQLGTFKPRGEQS